MKFSMKERKLTHIKHFVTLKFLIKPHTIGDVVDKHKIALLLYTFHT